jgi:hypothetical protein
VVAVVIVAGIAAGIVAGIVAVIADPTNPQALNQYRQKTRHH